MIRLAALCRILVVAVAIVPLLAVQSSALGVAAQSKERVIVVLRDDVADPAAVAQELGRAHGFTASHIYTAAVKGFAAEVPAQAIPGLRRNRRVAFVDPDLEVQTFAQTLPTGVDRIDADTNTTARIDGGDQRVDVDVAVIDTGSGPHVDLNVGGGKDCTGKGSYADDNGHGTHVAGIVGALDNGSGVVGVAPGARIWSIKVLNSAGSGYWSWIICGIDYVTQNAGVIEVANMSFGGSGTEGTSCSSSSLRLAICNSVNAGVTYVAAAGNSASNANTFVPATYPEVITVSALADFNGQPGGGAPPTCRSDVDDTFADFSNYGADVDLAAPGVCILSTWLGNSYATLSGTSMASPHVAGAAALYIAANGRVGPAAVKSGLQSAREQTHMAGDPDGIDEGIVNVGSSVAPTPTTTPTPTSTPALPTATPTNTPTNTPVPPTNSPTNTPVPPTNTPTNTPEVSAPVISNIAVYASRTTAYVRWTTDVPADSVVRYGVDGATNLVASDPTLTRSHTITLSGLERRTTYTYVVESTADGITTTSAPATFQTR
jgi:subtilisin